MSQFTLETKALKWIPVESVNILTSVNSQLTNWTGSEPLGDTCRLYIFFKVLQGLSNYSCACSVAKSCPTLCNPMDYNPPGLSVHGIFQARILEWVATSYFRESSQPSDWTHVSCVSCITGIFFATMPPEKHIYYIASKGQGSWGIYTPASVRILLRDAPRVLMFPEFPACFVGGQKGLQLLDKVWGRDADADKWSWGICTTREE